MYEGIRWASAGAMQAPAYKPIPRILCATDLSPGCEGARRRALLLAKQMDALLLLLHVVDEGQPLEIIGRSTRRARIALEAHRLKSGAEIAVHVGRPSRTIARLVEEWDTDLVVLGAYRERSGDRIFGTTTERVLRAGGRPVLMVNRKPSGPYQDILLASDLPETFAQVLRVSERFGLLGRARTSIVHVLAPDNHSNSACHDLVDQLEAAGLNAAHFTIVEPHGTPIEAIARLVENAKPQLLVIGATRHAALKRLVGASVTHDVVRSIGCDVLIVSVPGATPPPGA